MSLVTNIGRARREPQVAHVCWVSLCVCFSWEEGLKKGKAEAAQKDGRTMLNRKLRAPVGCVRAGKYMRWATTRIRVSLTR
jgi:hypothetical protein